MTGAWLAGLVLGLVPGTQEPPTWDPFPVFVWFVQGGPELGLAAFRELADHGLDGVNLEASQSHGTEAREAGLRVYVGHTAGKGDLHLRRERFQEDLDRFLAHREGAAPQRPSCLADPALAEALREKVRATVARQGSAGVLGFSLDDEISSTVGLNPIDYCFAPGCLAAMRDWLRQRHGSLARLNQRWGTSFGSWDEVEPRTTDQSRQGLGDRTLTEVRLTSWNDHRAFQDEQLARLVDLLVEELGRLLPGVPAGFLGGQAPSAFGGFDWWRLTRTGTFFEAYDYGCAPRLARAFAPPEARLITTLFLDEEGRDRESVTQALWRAMARGEDGVVVWASDRVFQGREPRLSEAGRSLAEQIRQVRQVRAALADRVAPAPRVGVYVSMDSVRAGWMLDSWTDGATWPRRFTSWEQEHSRTIRSREAWAMLLDDAGVAWTFLDSRQLCAGGGEDLDLEVLVLHEAMALSDAEVLELLAFVEAGGVLVADAHVALFDEHLQGRDSEALARLFGVMRDDSVTFGQLARRLAGTSDEGEARDYFGLRRGEVGLVPGPEVQVRALGWRRMLGEGVTLLLDLDLKDAEDASRNRGEAFGPLRDLLWDLWEESGVAPPVRVSSVDEEPAVRPVFFDGASGPCLLLVPVSGPWQAHQVELESPEPVKWGLLWDGPAPSAGRSLRLEIPPRQVRILTWQPAGA